jgi:hypothetical protein
LITYAPDGPFTSGQSIEVQLGPNRLFKRGASLTIEECAAPTRRNEAWQGHCDARTRQQGRLVAGVMGTLDYPDYPVFALPDAINPRESADQQPVCDLTHACVLVISQNVNEHSDGDHDSDDDGDHDGDDSGYSAWSLPFFVGLAVDPPPSAPEVPYVLALPVLVAGMLGGSVLLRRRRSATTRIR